MGHYMSVERDVRLYVEDINPSADRIIVFIHGWPGSHTLFEYQFNYLPKAGYRCIGIDCRGFGKSARPWSGYDYNRLSDDIRVIVGSLNIRNFTLLGHSTGGAICVRYMARHQGFGVSKLVLCAAAAPSLIERPYFPYGLKPSDVFDIIEGVYTDRPRTIKDFGNRVFYNRVSDELLDWLFQLGLEAASWSTAAIANTWLGEEALFDDLKTITAPTLILHGLNDQVCLYPLAIAQHQCIPNSILVPIKNCGHFLFYDQLAFFNKTLLTFLENN